MSVTIFKKLTLQSKRFWPYKLYNYIHRKLTLFTRKCNGWRSVTSVACRYICVQTGLSHTQWRLYFIFIIIGGFSGVGGGVKGGGAHLHLGVCVQEDDIAMIYCAQSKVKWGGGHSVNMGGGWA